MPRETTVPNKTAPPPTPAADTMPTMDDVTSVLENDVYYRVLRGDATHPVHQLGRRRQEYLN